METASVETVIHRKARAARDGADTRSVSPAKALRLALAKAADEELGLALTVNALEQSLVTRSELVSHLDGLGLLVLVEGETARRGVVRLDFAALASLIEQQTIGFVSDREAAPRDLTSTDAALAAPWVDAMLDQFGKRLDGVADAGVWQGYGFGAKVEDVHGLGLALDSEKFHYFRIAVSFAAGTRAGVIDVAFPKPEPNEVANTAGFSDGDCLTQTLNAVAMDAPVTLHAVLDRISMPLSQSLKLAVGDLVHLTRGTAMELRLEGARGHLVSVAKLGQIDGARAVRLLPDVRPQGEDAARRTPDEMRGADADALPLSRREGADEAAAALSSGGTDVAPRQVGAALGPPDPGKDAIPRPETSEPVGVARAD